MNEIESLHQQRELFRISYKDLLEMPRVAQSKNFADAVVTLTRLLFTSRVVAFKIDEGCTARDLVNFVRFVKRNFRMELHGEFYVVYSQFVK